VEELTGRIAVVTGAASGIGRALAERFAAEGMKVVLADVEADALEQVADELAGTGAEVLAVRTDVADRSSVDSLATATVDRFGVPHVLCNNAGVSGTFGPIWEASDADWAWVMGVNLMGVVHGIQAFVPAMVRRGEPGHVVNTSSVLGLGTGGGSIYSVTKHAVTRLTEGLWHDLRAAGSPVSASVLCPGLIATRIVTAARNRPDHLRDADRAVAEDDARRMEAAQAFFLESGMPPAEVAAMVVDAIRTDRFYVLTHPEMILDQVRARTQGILDGRLTPQERPGEGLLARAARHADEAGRAGEEQS
jgi:NAD(P)-dependent dehydrogenase (short-subunit alcohol dehydrogenase family)